ncbi:flagellar basal body rod protein FlgC [Phosphitispora fastidiosa]|uniref:flagellar basal body rod protein FlgC n=1 Tax=Phosphitispora fastidiosa TaxID=2837202 RepID=UPI001E4CC7F3|nr:flagellar basal body rod protein FlgC [Phosphitispora fastidiosa]MBU7008262.1 flagellar basal-body rod protein FlgC [Phosphitispora fastidiosa]
MNLFKALDISASGMTAQRLRMDLISENIANINTTRTEAGGPYRRKMAIFEARGPESSFAGILGRTLEQQKTGAGVRVLGINEDKSPFKMVYDPNHPDANDEGYVSMPNVNIVTEMVNMISATRSYEANVTATKASKDIALKAMEIGK